MSINQALEHATLKNLVYLSGGYIALQSLLFSYTHLRKLFSPLRHLSGPPNDSLIFGNSKRVFGAPLGVVHEEWMEKYGPTYAFRLLYAEFGMHKRQRRLMNPSFGPPQVRALVPVFWNKANELRNIWLDMMKEGSQGSVVINVLPWLARATLDIIGVAGFDYHFNSLTNEDDDELAKAFAKIFQAGQELTPFSFLKNFIPGFRLLPDARSERLKTNKTIMNRIGKRLVEEKKAALAEEQKTGSTAQGRDLLTLLIKSNMAYENEGQRMSDEEVLG
ncbi:hypothetical protein FRC06_010258, partial [Ceratobasidium sp. 370]